MFVMKCTFLLLLLFSVGTSRLLRQAVYLYLFTRCKPDLTYKGFPFACSIRNCILTRLNAVYDICRIFLCVFLVIRDKQWFCGNFCPISGVFCPSRKKPLKLHSDMQHSFVQQLLHAQKIFSTEHLGSETSQTLIFYCEIE